LSGKPTTLQLVERAARARGLSEVDFDYPDHFGTDDPAALVARAGRSAWR
jgi:xylose isomerase